MVQRAVFCQRSGIRTHNKLFYQTMKQYFVNSLAVLFVVVLTGFGCNRETYPPGPCETIATVRNNICGLGLWGALVLELPDGEIVQPWSSTDPMAARMPLKEGMKIRLSLRTTERDDRYKNHPVCFALGPYDGKISRAVEITCISDYQEQAACNTRATVRNNICGSGLWGAFVLELPNGEIVQPWMSRHPDIANAQLKDGQQIRVNISTIIRDSRYDTIPVCLAYGPYTNRIKRAVEVLCLSDNNRNKIPVKDNSNCTAEVFAEDMGCAAQGIWKGIWLRTSEGQYLQPLQLGSGLSGIQLQHGQRLRIGFTLISNSFAAQAQEEHCQDEALPPSIPVNIHCISQSAN
jgi:hypothetical protein